MNKHVEKEYKMLVSKEQFDKLCSLYENLNFITQTNTYYDTVNGDIQKKKGAMRIRERNGRFLFTLKMRQENLDGLCECECEVSENSVHALQSEEIVQLLHEYQIEAAIIPLTTLVTKRAVVIQIMKLNMNISSHMTGFLFFRSFFLMCSLFMKKTAHLRFSVLCRQWRNDLRRLLERDFILYDGN